MLFLEARVRNPEFRASLQMIALKRLLQVIVSKFATHSKDSLYALAAI